MSRKASINMCKEPIAIYERLLDDMKKTFASLEVAISDIEKQLNDEKQKLAELEQEGGKR